MGALVQRGRAGLWILGLALLAPSSSWANTGTIPTAFFSDGSSWARQLETRVLLDQELRRVKDWRDARLIWIVGALLPPSDWQQVLEQVRQGAGLVLVPGRQAPTLSPLGLSVVGRARDRVSLRARPGHDRMITEEVVWPSAPQAAARWTLMRLPGCTLEPLVQEQGSDAPALLMGNLGAGRVAIFSLRFTDPSNRELILWPYFNYLLHVLSARVGQGRAEPFATWPASPVPGKRTLWTLLTVLSVLWLLTLGLFLRVRRYSRAHPEIPERFFTRPRVQPAGAPAGADDNWHSIGFTRPLAGFLTLTGTLFLLFAPWYYVTNILIPNDVQPFPQSKGMWDFAWEALQIAWFLFDAGTFVAFVKYFAEFRVKDPAEAVRSAQFFVWWQILTGLVQVSMACIVAVVFLPHTRYGFSSNFVILIALSQYPGCFGVVTFFFQAYQRFDYNIGLDLLSDWVLRFLLQIPCVLFFRAWGVANPQYGEAFGAAVGIGVGFYVSTLVTFFLGVVLYKRLGLRLTPLFMAHFDLSTAKRMLAFGLKVVAGQAFFRAAKTIDRVVISLLLLNYTEWLGIEGQIHYNLMFLFPIAYRFFETAMAALSESYGNHKPVLTQYYVVRFFQVGSLYTAIGLSLLWALGPVFVRHAMDPQWARAADYMVIAAVIGAFYAPAWISDMLQKGAGRPGLFAVILGLEQSLRIGLFWVLIPRWQFHGFYMALLITIALKVVGAWIVNHWLILRLRVFPWQMFVAPALAGVGNFIILRLLSDALGLSGRFTVSALFLIGALVSFFICFFFCGLAGGFDRASSAELQRAVAMTGPLRPLTRLFYLAARAGWALSPLHGRFPVSIEGQARQEAQALESRRREMDDKRESVGA